MRSFSKNKFLLCFRPVVDMDAMLLESKVAPRRSTSHKHDNVKNSESKSLYFHHLSPKQTISRVVKAVFFETILNRRSHHKNRYIQDSYGYNKPKYLTYEETKTIESSLPSTSSSQGLPSPTSSSHASLHSKNVSNYYSKRLEKKQGDPVEKQNKFECYGIYFVLISLAFTVLWGKLFGILMTSTWLYFFTLWDSCTRYQKRVPTCPRLRQSLQGQDIKNYYMPRNNHMALVPFNHHVTHNRNLYFTRKNY